MAVVYHFLLSNLTSYVRLLQVKIYINFKMTLTADKRLPANYMHVYWSNSNGLPAAQGLFAKHIDKEKSHAIQQVEAEKLLTYITSVPTSYDDLVHTGLPFPMLDKVPGTHNICFITGLAPLEQGSSRVQTQLLDF